jgi:hypothetical protein
MVLPVGSLYDDSLLLQSQQRKRRDCSKRATIILCSITTCSDHDTYHVNLMTSGIFYMAGSRSQRIPIIKERQRVTPGYAYEEAEITGATVGSAHHTPHIEQA